MAIENRFQALIDVAYASNWHADNIEAIGLDLFLALGRLGGRSSLHVIGASSFSPGLFNDCQRRAGGWTCTGTRHLRDLTCIKRAVVKGDLIWEVRWIETKLLAQLEK